MPSRGVTANSNGDVAMLGNTDAGWGVYLYTAKDKKLKQGRRAGRCRAGRWCVRGCLQRLPQLRAHW